MAEIECREPGNGGTVVAATSGDTIKFPNVDSCVAVVLFLSNGKAVGGHVPMQWDARSGLDPAGNFTRMIGDMRAEARRLGAGVASAVSIGDVEELEISYGVERLGSLSGCSRFKHVPTGRGGANIYVNVRTQGISVVFRNV
jgi:hypothetical protein